MSTSSTVLGLSTLTLPNISPFTSPTPLTFPHPSKYTPPPPPSLLSLLHFSHPAHSPLPSPFSPLPSPLTIPLLPTTSLPIPPQLALTHLFSMPSRFTHPLPNLNAFIYMYYIHISSSINSIHLKKYICHCSIVFRGSQKWSN